MIYLCSFRYLLLLSLIVGVRPCLRLGNKLMIQNILKVKKIKPKTIVQIPPIKTRPGTHQQVIAIPQTNIPKLKSKTIAEQTTRGASDHFFLKGETYLEENPPKPSP